MEAIIRAIGFETITISKIMMRARITLHMAEDLLVELKGAGLVRGAACPYGRWKDPRVSKWYELTEHAKACCRELLVLPAS